MRQSSPPIHTHELRIFIGGSGGIGALDRVMTVDGLLIDTNCTVGCGQRVTATTYPSQDRNWIFLLDSQWVAKLMRLKVQRSNFLHVSKLEAHPNQPSESIVD